MTVIIKNTTIKNEYQLTFEQFTGKYKLTFMDYNC